MVEVMDLLGKRWHVVADDIIGGWCVANTPKPPSEHDAGRGECYVANFFSERQAADHIVELHNEWLDLGTQ